MARIAVFLLVVAPLLAQADVRRFGWLDEPTVLKDGHVEIETSMILGMGAENAEGATFRTYRPELRMQAGLSDSVQLSVGAQLLSLLVISDSYYLGSGRFGVLLEEATAELEIHLGSTIELGGVSLVTGLGYYDGGVFQAATLGVRLAHASPSLVLAGELLARPGFAVQPGTDQLELRTVGRLGIAGNVGGSAWLGFELRAEGYISLTSDDQVVDESVVAIYAGPTFSILRDRFWLTLAVEPQLPSPVTRGSDTFAPFELVAIRGWLAGSF